MKVQVLLNTTADVEAVHTLLSLSWPEDTTTLVVNKSGLTDDQIRAMVGLSWQELVVESGERPPDSRPGLPDFHPDLLVRPRASSSQPLERMSTPVLLAAAHPIARVLVATHPSAACELAISTLSRWGILRGLHLRLLSCVDYSPLAAGELASVLPLLHQATEASALADREELRQAGVSAAIDVRSDRPADAIVNAADDFGADLVILGSRGPQGLLRYLTGDLTASILDRFHGSVLIFPGEGTR